MYKQLCTASVAVAILSTACGGGWKAHKASALAQHRTANAKVAVVSLSVNDYAGVLKNYNVSGADVNAVINARMIEMHRYAEDQLGQQRFTVVPAADFADQAGFRAVPAGSFDVFQPSVDGAPLPVFAQDRSDLVSATIAPTVAQQIAEAIDVDLVVVVYSEWATKTGRFVPTTKALAKNVLGVYDRSGQRLFGDRRDTVGPKNIGVFNINAVNDETIQNWVMAYQEGIDAMIGAL